MLKILYNKEMHFSRDLQENLNEINIEYSSHIVLEFTGT